VTVVRFRHPHRPSAAAYAIRRRLALNIAWEMIYASRGSPADCGQTFVNLAWAGRSPDRLLPLRPRNSDFVSRPMFVSWKHPIFHRPSFE
jgi:hypothetical protein